MPKAEPNEQLLNAIYQNAKMGEEAISMLLSSTPGEAICADLQTQLQNYTTVATEAANQLIAHKAAPQDNPPMEKVGLWGSVKVNMLTDKSPSHIAEMMIQGSTMGIVDMTKQLKEAGHAEQTVVDLGNSLIQDEQNHIERMKTYLQ